MSVTFATPISPVSTREDGSMMKTTIFKALALGLLPLALISGPADAQGVGGCLAFNTSMVDATYMATDVSGPLVSVDAMDDPRSGTIECVIGTDAGSDFMVIVTASDILLVGRHTQDQNDDLTELRTRVLPVHLELEIFTPTQLHACRGAVRQSFAWKQICASEAAE